MAELRPAEAALDLLPLVYDLGGEGWSPFLEALSRWTGSGLAAIHRYDFERRQGDFEHGVHTVDESWRDAYREYFCHINPYLQGGNRRHLRTDRAVLGSDLLPLRELATTEFYCDFLRPQKLHHSIGIVGLRDASVNVSLTALRAQGRGPYSPQEQRLFTLLGPHLRQALGLRRRLGELELTLEGLSAALDRLPQGALLLDGSNRPLFVNRRATELLAQEDGLSLGRGGLEAARSRESILLRRLLARGPGGDEDRVARAGGAVRLPRPSCSEPLSLLVSHLPSRRPGAGEGEFKLVFVSDPDAAPAAAEGRLRTLYGLTPTEARLTGRLLRGRSLAEAAEEMEITVGTARTHLKRVFAKTGTHRQAELVRRCLQGVAGLGRG